MDFVIGFLSLKIYISALHVVLDIMFAAPVSLIEDASYNMIAHRQVNMILLDFSKVFDIVPHHQVLLKMKYYRTDNQAVYQLDC